MVEEDSIRRAQKERCKWIEYIVMTLIDLRSYIVI